MRVAFDPEHYSVGMHLVLTPSAIDGLVYAVGDVDTEKGDVTVRFVFSEVRKADVLDELSDDDLLFIRYRLRLEAEEWVQVQQAAREAGYRRSA